MASGQFPTQSQRESDCLHNEDKKGQRSNPSCAHLWLNSPVICIHKLIWIFQRTKVAVILLYSPNWIAAKSYLKLKRWRFSPTTVLSVFSGADTDGDTWGGGLCKLSWWSLDDVTCVLCGLWRLSIVLTNPYTDIQKRRFSGSTFVQCRLFRCRSLQAEGHQSL